MMTDSRNQQLQHKIKSLSAFKTHFSVFAVVIGSLWLVWYFVGQTTIYAWPPVSNHNLGIYPFISFSFCLPGIS